MHPKSQPKKTETMQNAYCTDSKGALSSLPSSQFWKRILEAAKIRDDKRVLEISESLEFEEDFPNIQYRNRCRRKYTHSGTLERISNKRKVY